MDKIYRKVFAWKSGMEFANYKSIKIRTKEGRKTMEKTKKIGPVALGAVFMAYFCSITAVPTGGLVGQGAKFTTGLAGMALDL